VVSRTHRGEADTAVAEDDRGDAVGGRRLETIVPRDLPVVVGVEVEEPGGDDRPVGVDLLAGSFVDRADGSSPSSQVTWPS
jgi:hypothetical protein